MDSANSQSGSPQTWRLEVGRDPADGRLVFGRHCIALKDIVSVGGETEQEWPIGGLMMGAGLCAVVASIVAHGVSQNDWSSRWLIAATLLAVLAASGVIEAYKLKSRNLYRVYIRLSNGELVVYSSTDAHDAGRLIARIQP